MDIDAVADDLIGSGVMPPLLIVMPNADNAYWGSWYVNSEVTGNWEDFIVRELVDYVDGHYATLAQRESRALAGHSMGGYGAAYLGIKYAETYSVLYPMSAAAIDMETFILEVPVSGFPSGPTAFLTIANWDHFPGKSFTDWVAKANVALAAAIAPAPAEPRFLADMPMVEEAGEAHVDEAVFERWMAADPLSMIATHTEDLRRYAAVRVDCGDADDLIGQNRNFSAALTAAGIEHQFEDYPGNHTSNVAARMKSVVLPFIGTHLSSYPTVTTVESASWGRIKIRHVGGM